MPRRVGSALLSWDRSLWILMLSCGHDVIRKAKRHANLVELPPELAKCRLCEPNQKRRRKG